MDNRGRQQALPEAPLSQPRLQSAVRGLEPSFLKSSPLPASFHGRLCYPVVLNAMSDILGAGFLLSLGCTKATPQVQRPRCQCQEPRMKPQAPPNSHVIISKSPHHRFL